MDMLCTKHDCFGGKTTKTLGVASEHPVHNKTDKEDVFHVECVIIT